MAANDSPNFYSTPAARSLDLPFSEAVQVGNLVFLSGQLGNVPGTMDLVAGGIESETRQTMDNIRAVLAGLNLGMDDLVKCTAFLADISEWAAFNAVYAAYFSGDPPARSALGVNGLALGARVELECVAVADAQDSP